MPAAGRARQVIEVERTAIRPDRRSTKSHRARADGRGGAPRPNRRADERAFVEHRESIACAAFVDTAGRRLSLPVFIVEINAVLPAVASDAAWFADLGARVGS
jgi:hypothetical protein